MLSAVNNRCAIVFQTGGFVFSVFCGAFFPWGGDGRHLIVGGGGMGGSSGGGGPVKNLVWTTAGGGDLGG